MRIEEEIKQVQFESDRQKLLINLLHTHSRVINELNLFFKPFGLTRQQYNVLRILRGQHPKYASVGLLRERMIEKMSDASRIVERLRIKGLIEKCDNKQDKRETLIIITDKGLDLLTVIDKETDAFDHIFKHIDDKSVQQLNFLLDKVHP